MLLQAYYATRHPESRVRFISCGIGGDTTSDMIARFEGDVMRYNPNYALLMTGMNDMSTALYYKDIEVNDALLAKREASMQRYYKLTEQLINMMLERGIKPILLTPTFYDETAQLATPTLVGKCAALLKCADHIKAMGKKYNIPVVDLTQFMLSINLDAQKSNPEYTIISGDRVHPADTGHFIMAYRVISTLWSNEKIVNKESIDAKSRDEITFEVTPSALPFPIRENFVEAQRFVPFVEEHNREILEVRNLKKGEYLLSIDDIVVDTLSSHDLQRGVNFATNHHTPQYKQAEEVFALCEKYHATQTIIRHIANVEYKRLKNYKGEDSMAAKQKYLDAENEKSKGKPWYGSGVKIVNSYYKNKPQEAQITKELDDIHSQIYTINAPRKATYRLKRL